jgi:hypothetical protein
MEEGALNPQTTPQDRSQAGPGNAPSPDLFQPDDRVKDILWGRIDALAPEELEMLDAMVSPQSIHLWLKLFPELAELLAEATAFDQAVSMSQEASAGAMPAGPMPAPAPTPVGLAGQRFG